MSHSENSKINEAIYKTRNFEIQIDYVSGYPQYSESFVVLWWNPLDSIKRKSLKNRENSSFD